ncbi:GIY-YIG nuclease family protein [Neisseria animalis]|nr:GIY-YIG nuclease family protein [Neisseria animalis]
MPGLVKIGFTKNRPSQRAKELYGTGVAYPFEVAYQLRCYRYREVEKAAHDALSGRRVNGGREFFACTVDEAAEVLNYCAGKYLIEAQDLRSGLSGSRQMLSPPPSGRLQKRHFLWGTIVSAALLLVVWVVFRYASERPNGELVGRTEISEMSALEDVNMRTCPSTDCEVIAVLPAQSPIAVQFGTQTKKNWIYAEFHGDVCYPQYYLRGSGCREWAVNNIVEGWVYMPNLMPTENKQASDLEALF